MKTNICKPHLLAAIFMIITGLLIAGCNISVDMGGTQQPNQNQQTNQTTNQQQLNSQNKSTSPGTTQPSNNQQKSTSSGTKSGGSQPAIGGAYPPSSGQNTGNWWNSLWGGDSGGYSYDDYGTQVYDYGYGDYGYGDYSGGGGGYYDPATQEYLNQGYQDIYEHRAQTNQEISDNTSQWLYEGEANYINPETGELESKDYSEGEYWYQDETTGEQYQTDDSSYTPEYSYEAPMEEYSGWASDYNPSDYGYDSGSSYDYSGGYDSGSYDYGSYDY